MPGSPALPSGTNQVTTSADDIMLRKKTLVIIGATVLGLVVLLYITFNATLLQSYEAIEKRNTETNVIRVLNYINDETLGLSLQIKDWAQWDDTYAFIQGDEPDFIEDNLMDAVFSNLSLNLMTFVNNDGEVVFSKAFDLNTLTEIPLPVDIQDYINEQPLLTSPDDLDTDVWGLMVMGDLPMMVASTPILTSSGDGPPMGTLIWARFLNAEVVEAISSFVEVPVRLERLDNPALPVEFAAARDELTFFQPVSAHPVDDTMTAGYGLVNDIYGQPALLLRIQMPRDIFQQGQITFSYVTLALIASGLIFVAVVLILLERLILSRLARLNNAVRGIGERGDFSTKIDVEGDDELANLATAINTTLEALAHSQNALQQLNADLERRVAERTAELEGQKTYLQTILDSMSEGVIYGTDDHIDYVNHMMATMSGYAETDFVGKPPDFLFSASRPTDKRVYGGLDSNPGRWVQRGERKLRCKDGSIIDVAYTITPLRGVLGLNKKIYLIRDVTEEKIQQARSDRFLAHASHELRTPLTNLMTRIYLMRRQPDLYETHLTVLDNVTAHMKALVEDLLDISRFKRGTLPLKRERVNVQGLIRDVVDVQMAEAAQKRTRLTMTLIDEPVDIFVDRKRFKQVLTNLVMNAINYTPEEGHVSVELATEEHDSITYALMRVRDDGVGMDADDVSQIFQPFFRVSQETTGTGLGLAIVKEIVEQHGGDILVSSQPGSGSVFTVKIVTFREPTPEDNLVTGEQPPALP